MRLTRNGWGVLVTGVILYVIGSVLGYPELIVAAATLVLLVIAAVVWTVRPPTLSVRREVEPVRVRRGDPALGLVEVRNSGRNRSPRMHVEDHAGGTTVGVELPPLRPGQRHSATYRVPSDRRGVYEIGPLAVAQTDPFALMSRKRITGNVMTLWVHPRTYPVPASRSGRTVEMDGPVDDTAPEGTITFQGLRPYVMGDDLRMIHWRTTARTGTLMVKKHTDPNRPQVVVVLDDRRQSYAAEGWFEDAVDTAASLVEQALRVGAPVRLDLVSGALTGYQPSGPRDMLDRLATVHLAEGGSFAGAVAALQSELGGSAAILVTGSQPPDDVAALERLGARYRRVSALLLGGSASSAHRAGPLEVCQGRSAPAVLQLWQAGSG